MTQEPIVLVARQSDGSYSVKVRAEKAQTGRDGTSHLVSVPTGYAERLGLAGVPGEDLVRASFAFLLDREPASSILPRFSLDVIGHYFAEYQAELPAYLGSRDGGGPVPR